MPMIDITMPRGSLAPGQSAALQDELATLLLEAEGAPDTAFFRNITWVYMHEVESVLVGGRPGGKPRYRVQITVPAGALNSDSKTKLAGGVYDALARALGFSEPYADDERALHVWTIITEAPDGNWSAGGKPVYYDDLKKIAAQERENEAATPAAPADAGEVDDADPDVGEAYAEPEAPVEVDPAAEEETP